MNKNKEIFLSLSRSEFYQWLKNNHNKLSSCFIEVKRCDPRKLKNNELSYLDAVEVALCFGWIDSCLKKKDNILYQRFSPRKNKSHWTELNKERCRRLIKKGEMTKYGLKVCPNLSEPFIEPLEIIEPLKKNNTAYIFFRKTPKLYQKIRIDNIFHYRLQKKEEEFEKALKKLIEQCEKHQMYGNFDDFGRLL